MLSRTLKSICLVVSLFLLTPAPGAAQVDFDINVPDRCPSGNNGTPADGLPISRIHATLEFSSSVTISSGWQLQRSDSFGSATVGLNTGGRVSFGNGDSVLVVQSGQSVHIYLYPLSNRQSSGNKCARNAPCGSSSSGTGAFSLTLENSSGSSPMSSQVQEYHLTSYRALSEPYACQCGTAQRRIVTEPARWSIRPAGPSKDEGRHPLGVVMVLDESGSMSATLSNSNDTRIERLRQNASNTIDLWRTNGGNSSDQVGVVFFTTGVRTLNPGGSFLVPRSSGNWGSLITDIRNATPQNLTAMGDGLKEAYDRSGTGDVSLVLFTDGIENTGGYRTRACSELPPGTCSPGEEMNLNNSGTGDRTSIPGDGCKLVQTIGLGAPGSVHTQDLNQIATQTGGEDRSGLDDEVMDAGSFQRALLNILDAGSLQEVLRVSSTLSEGGQSGVSRTVQVNRSAEQLITSLSWYGLDNQYALNLGFEGPDGRTREPDRVTRRRDYRIASFDLESEEDAGEWQINVDRGDSGGAVDYELAAMLDDTVFRYQLDWHRDQYFTGDPMYLALTLTENGQPTQALDPSAIEARLLRPKRGLGTILHEADLPSQISRGENGDQPNTPYGRKLQSLLAEEGMRDSIRPVSLGKQLEVRTDTVRLPDGTTIGGSGTYLIAVPNTQVPGTYKVNLRFRGELEQSGTVERTDQIQTEVGVRPNLAESQVKARSQGDSVGVQFIPRDLFGNHLGPGYAQRLSVSSADREVPYPVTVSDQSTRGIYQMAISDVSVDENPRLVFRLNGRPYHAVTVDQLVSGEIPSAPNLQGGDEDRGIGFGCSCNMGSDESNTASVPAFLILLLLTFMGRAAYRHFGLKWGE